MSEVFTQKTQRFECFKKIHKFACKVPVFFTKTVKKFVLNHSTKFTPPSENRIQTPEKTTTNQLVWGPHKEWINIFALYLCAVNRKLSREKLAARKTFKAATFIRERKKNAADLTLSFGGQSFATVFMQVFFLLKNAKIVLLCARLKLTGWCAILRKLSSF